MPRRRLTAARLDDVQLEPQRQPPFRLGPRRRVLVLAVLLASVVACGTEAAAPDRATSEPVLHSGVGTVLESPEHGPELCLGGVADSLPPQCGGVPLRGWDWAEVSGEEQANGTTWGDYRVTGRYDGTSLTLTAPPTAPASSDAAALPADPFGTPCAPPDGGWQVVDASRTGEVGIQAAVELTRTQPDFAGLWIDQPPPGDQPEAAPPPEQQVLNVAFTGDLDRHEAELRRVWGGPLCVSLLPRTHAELLALQDELTTSAAEELGLEPLFASANEPRGVVELGVVAVTPAQQAAVEDRYGNAVELIAGLEPVS